MEGEKKNIFIVVAVILALVFGVWLIGGFSFAPDTGGAGSDVPSAPTFSQALQVTPEEKRGDVTRKKEEILTRVRSASVLSLEEKEEIGGIMLTKSRFYNFTDAEREAIFSALQR